MTVGYEYAAHNNHGSEYFDDLIGYIQKLNKCLYNYWLDEPIDEKLADKENSWILCRDTQFSLSSFGKYLLTPKCIVRFICKSIQNQESYKNAMSYYLNMLKDKIASANKTDN